MLRGAGHAAVVVALTLLTQVGGVAWLIALVFRKRLLGFALAYAALTLGAVFVAPVFGRAPLPCLSSGPKKSKTPAGEGGRVSVSSIRLKRFSTYR